jgi:virginiamycin A acetyltransferase
MTTITPNSQPPNTQAPNTAAPNAQSTNTAATAPPADRLYPDCYGPKAGRILGDPQVVYLRTLVQSPFTSVGEYTYYADPIDPTGFERHNVLFHHGPERLVIGKFCALAQGVRFLMNSANHRHDGISAYPFPMFGGEWLQHMDLLAERPRGQDTRVGNDVWLGTGAVVLPGVRIGDGAIVGAMSVVTADVPAYAVVAGNPARIVRRRFTDDDVERLIRLAWWDWPIEIVTRHLRTIIAGDVEDLAAAARNEGIAPD